MEIAEGTTMKTASTVLTLSMSWLALSLVACSESSPGEGSGSASLEVYQDGCDAAACGERPAPAHACVGGHAVSVCTTGRGSCGWQVDCQSEPPADYDPGSAIGSCEVDECGDRPSFDAADCVYGFVGEPVCQRRDRQACAWERSCRPEPCEKRGDCNQLDRSRLGAACDAETACAAGQECASFWANVGEGTGAVCFTGDGCGDVLQCAAGRTCIVLESYPPIYTCN